MGLRLEYKRAQTEQIHGFMIVKYANDISIVQTRCKMTPGVNLEQTCVAVGAEITELN